MRRSPFRLLGLLNLALLALSLPFELESPSIPLGASRLTNIEILLAMSLVWALVVVVAERRWRLPRWTLAPTAWLWLWGLFVLGLGLSTVLAPELSSNALKAAVRTCSGLLLALAVPQIVRTQRDFSWIVTALLAGSLLSAASGLLEILSGQPLEWLNLFRVSNTVVGPFARLSGTFDHANQTAMFIEATLPLLAASGWLAIKRGQRLLAGFAVLACLLYLEASLLTLSRSSFATIFISNFIVAILVLWRQSADRRRLAYPWLAIAGLIILFVFVNSRSSPAVRLRLTSEGDSEWYDLSFRVPQRLTLTAGKTQQVMFRVTNEGSLTWASSGPNPILVGGRWHRKPGDQPPLYDLRWSLERRIGPGESITMSVPVRAPANPGQYWLEWDLVQEHIAWFSVKNGLQTFSPVTVEVGTQTGAVNTQTDPANLTSATSKNLQPLGEPIPDRRTLWHIAAKQLSMRPLWGIGLDNFRLTYGHVLGWPSWNRSIHTNNWYIETIVSLGVLGSAPFFAWLVLLGVNLVRNVRDEKSTIWHAALAIGLVAYLLHGLLDYFLLFNGTGLLFWLLVGLWIMQQANLRPATRSQLSLMSES